MAVEKVGELEAKLPNDYCRTVLQGGLMVLDSDNPIRAHLFAAALRELLGYLLHSAAPDEDVLAAPWYVATEDRPTRRQRATFAIQGGLADEAVERLGLDAQDMHRDLAKAVSALNRALHLRPDTLLTDDAKIQAFANEVVAAVLEFIETIEQMREMVAEAVIDDASLPVFGSFLQESNEMIDMLSNRSIVEEVEVETLNVIRIGLLEIEYEAEGSVYVELNYGPKSDSVSMSDSFPFTCKMTGKIDPLKAIERVTDMKIDTSDFYE